MRIRFRGSFSPRRVRSENQRIGGTFSPKNIEGIGLVYRTQLNEICLFVYSKLRISFTRRDELTNKVVFTCLRGPTTSGTSRVTSEDVNAANTASSDLSIRLQMRLLPEDKVRTPVVFNEHINFANIITIRASA